jgi:hypothetical protein
VSRGTGGGTHLVLHVGIHKTASTYIQHRLKGNPAFLRQQRLLYPSRRSEHLHLVKALRRGDPQPWEQLLQQARHQDSRALVSAEILSLVLAEPGHRGAGSLLSELLQWLSAQDIGLELVAFVRDQPTYLNSRYTQLLKRFYLASSFRRYVRQTLRRGGESKCDYLELFGEALDRPEVRCHFLPFRAGEADPCERLLQAVGIVNLSDLRPLAEQANVQPGWQAVWIARRIAASWLSTIPRPGTAQPARPASAIGSGAPGHWSRAGRPPRFKGSPRRCWPVLSSATAAATTALPERVWGCSWRELFPAPHPQASPAGPRSPEERQSLQALVDQLLAVGLREPPAADQA